MTDWQAVVCLVAVLFWQSLYGVLYGGRGVFTPRRRSHDKYIYKCIMYIYKYIYINVFPVEHFATCDIEAKGDEIWTFPHQIVQSCVWCIKI